MRRRAGALVGALVMAGLLASAEVSLARFHDSERVTASFATATLAPPTGLAATGGGSAALSWVPSASGWATGYEVFRSATSGSGYALAGAVTPVAAASSTDSPGAGTWYYVLRTTFHSWTSDSSNEASVVVGTGPITAPPADCTTTAAETANAGDNDGYERNPGRACALDGSPAVDASTGTGTENSCTSNTRDRHRFWGYALGLPAAVDSINGITVTAVAGQNNSGGTTWLCVELSPDAGAT